jgi:hypothetical protein
VAKIQTRYLPNMPGMLLLHQPVQSKEWKIQDREYKEYGNRREDYYTIFKIGLLRKRNRKEYISKNSWKTVERVTSKEGTGGIV